LRKYADKRAETSVVRANRELAFLSIVFSYGFERDYVSTNPAKGVKKTAEPPRQRYVTDDEYAAVYEQAPATLQIAMEFAFLCRLRRGEVLALQRQHVLDGGLHVIRSKGSKDQIIEWTPRLRKVVRRAQKLPGQIASTYLIHNKYGQRVRNEAFKSAWQRAIAKAVKKSAIERFTFHDLKRKGVSDFSGDKLLASGHHSASMLRIYDVSIGTIPATK
jgi:integrase